MSRLTLLVIGLVVVISWSICGGSDDSDLERYLDKLLVDQVEHQLQGLEGACIDSSTSGWWKYRWCHKHEVRQFHKERNGKITLDWSAGTFVGGNGVAKRPSRSRLGTFSPPSYISYNFGDGQKCDETGTGRQTEVRLECCANWKRKIKEIDEMTKLKEVSRIHSIAEVQTCSYVLNICSTTMCTVPTLWTNLLEINGVGAKKTSSSSEIVQEQEDGDDDKWTIRRESNDGEDEDIVQEEDKTALEEESVSEAERIELLEMVKSAFYHGYNMYMTYAFPYDELKPISCSGENFDLTAGNMLTLIDSLDMLIIVGNYSEFARAVQAVQERADFDLDSTVSVFETTIRIVGGLLSAHMFATDPDLNVMPDYDGGLLDLAVDLADRLLPAFNTTTGIPYGTVNLRYGVPEGETTEACTAAAGTLSLEFGMLSVLTGNPKYGVAARDALKSIYDHRSSLGLVGRHIDVMSGRWTEPVAGIGSNIDSLYEYYLKHYLLFGDEEAYDMFLVLYEAAVAHLRIENTWYVDVNMHRGNVQRRQFNNLQAFWPGMQTLIGDLTAASRTINAFLQVWNEFGFTPEDFSIERWMPLSGGTRRGYPLRPELAESVYYLNVATQDPSWLVAGRDMMKSVEVTCRVECGYASVKDIKTEKLHDSMPSFFLSELLKYLYLLFDNENILREDRGANYVFTTEAHPFPVRYEYQRLAQEMKFSFTNSKLLGNTKKDVKKLMKHDLWGTSSLTVEMIQSRQCAALDLDSWGTENAVSMKHENIIEQYYGRDPELRKPRRSGFTSKPNPSRPPPFAAPVVSERAASPSRSPNSFQGTVMRLQSPSNKFYSVVTNEQGFLVEEEAEPHSKVSITSLGGNVISIKIEDGLTKEEDYLFMDADPKKPKPKPKPTPTGEEENTKREEDGNNGNKNNIVDEVQNEAIHCSLRYKVKRAFPSSGFVCRNEESKMFTDLLFLTTSTSLSQQMRTEVVEMIPCSISEFGPDPFKPKRIQAELVKPVEGEELGCSNEAFPEDNVRDNLVLVSRGECMFEQKAKYAGKSGAVGVVIVQNREDESLFFMVGMSVAAILKPFMPSTTIPAFMISKMHGALLNKVITELEPGQTLDVEVVVETASPISDPIKYPNAHMLDKQVVIQPNKNWGIQLGVTAGNKWVLSIN